MGWQATRKQGSRSAVVARFLSFLYLFASLVAALHHHDLPALGGQTKTSTITAFSAPVHAAPHSLASVAAATSLQAGDGDCAICDFIAHLVSSARHVTLPSLLTVAANLPAPHPCPAPHTPRRFCDHSSARAPPVV